MVIGRGNGRDQFGAGNGRTPHANATELPPNVAIRPREIERPEGCAVQRKIVPVAVEIGPTRFSGAACLLPRQNGDFRCLHFIMKGGSVSAMFLFECALDFEVITVA